LPAGNYSFTLDHDYPGSRVTIVRGKQTVAIILSPAVNYIKSGRSEIVLESGAVREVSLPQIGVSLHYPSPSPHRRTAPKELQLAQIIPVTRTSAGR
jgi:hypothetical protein